MTDEELISGCINKNAIAQKQLYDRFSRKMMGICLRYAENQEDAEDILQTGFVNIFENINAVKLSGSLDGWIRKIMVNTSLTHLRNNKKLQLNIELESVDFMLTSNLKASDNLATKDLLKLIQTLPAGFRMVFNLYAIEGYSHKEIAELLHISEGTSKSQYSRAKAYLQKLVTLD